MKKNIKIAIVVNDIEKSLDIGESTILMSAVEAVNRGHKVYFMGVGDLFYDKEEKVCAQAAHVNGKEYSSIEEYLEALKEIPREKYTNICISDFDVLLLRNDPSLEPPERAWARSIVLDFGMLATKHGVIVLNSPGGLSKSSNKLYLQHFPEEIRPKTIITRNGDELRKFFDEQKKVVIKPLSGSEGRNVFLVHGKDASNMNQMFEAVSRDGYVIAQEYLSAVDKGDTRIFLMNGEPLIKDGTYAAFKRVKKGNDIRNNISAGGKPRKAKITPEMHRIMDIIKPRLVQDGMFLVGLDIVGDKLIEINVYCPGGFANIEKVTGVNFATSIIDALERKVQYRDYYKGKFDNNQMATL
jgi:glutathione synthase